MEEVFKVYKITRQGTRAERVYEVSNYGRVKLNGKLVVPQEKYNKYIFYSCVSIHRAVAELFIPNPDNKPQVDHIDGDKHNNRVDNLRWVTAKENINNPTTLQRRKSRKGIKLTDEHKQHIKEHHHNVKGENNPRYGVKLENKTIDKIRNSVKAYYKKKREEI